MEGQLQSWKPLYRSSHTQMFFKISVLRNFSIFTGKHVLKSLLRGHPQMNLA